MATFITIAIPSCSDDDPTNISEDKDGNENYQTETPTIDVVKTIINRKICILGNNDNYPILKYLSRRLVNASTTLEADAAIIVISESEAGHLLTDTEKLHLLKDLWNQDKPFAFVKPSKNSLSLYAKLTNQSITDIPEENLEIYKDLSVFFIKASGNRLLYEKFHSTYHYQTTTITESENAQTTEKQENLSVNFTPTDYYWGQMAENICQWLNENITTKSQGHYAFKSRSAQEHATYVETTYRPGIVVVYDSYGKDPAPRTIHPIIRILTAAGFDKTNNCDVYDVKITEECPADSTYIENIVTQKKAAYKYKYTGGFYLGPDVKLTLSSSDKSFNFNGEKVNILDPVPIQSGGTYTETHIPANWTFGGNLSGSISNNGVGMGGGFSCSYTLPNTTTTKVIQEMPVKYSRHDASPIWKYSLSYGKIYHHEAWGFNASFVDGIPSIGKSVCITSQATAFTVKNSKTLGNANVYLTVNTDFKFHGKSQSPFKNFSQDMRCPTEKKIEMPKVYRYFEKYTPFPYNLEPSADSESWSNLEALLMTNVNYKNFKDNNLSVGASTEKGVSETALEIWEDAISSLIKQYNGTKSANNYIIALADSKGNKLPVGLQIKDGVWTKINLAN